MITPRRYASVIGLRPEHEQEYRELHAAVWPSVLKTIADCNLRNYSIYLYNGLLFSYYEYVGDDREADLARMAADPETQRWWTLTSPCQEPVPGTPEGTGWLEIQEVFHTD